MILRQCRSSAKSPVLAVAMVAIMSSFATWAFLQVGCSPDLASPQALLLRHAARGDREEAENLRARLHAEGQVLDEAAHVALIDLQSRTGNSDSTLAALDSMRDDGYEPPVESLSKAMAALAKDGRYDEVQAMLQSLRSEVGASEVPPSVWFWALLAAGRDEDSDHAIQIFRDLVDSGVEVTPYLLAALQNAVGPSRSRTLCKQRGIDLHLLPSIGAETGAGLLHKPAANAQEAWKRIVYQKRRALAYRFSRVHNGQLQRASPLQREGDDSYTGHKTAWPDGGSALQNRRDWEEYLAEKGEIPYNYYEDWKQLGQSKRRAVKRPFWSRRTQREKNGE